MPASCQQAAGFFFPASFCRRTVAVGTVRLPRGHAQVFERPRFPALRRSCPSTTRPNRRHKQFLLVANFLKRAKMAATSSALILKPEMFQGGGDRAARPACAWSRAVRCRPSRQCEGPDFVRSSRFFQKCRLMNAAGMGKRHFRRQWPCLRCTSKPAPCGRPGARPLTISPRVQSAFNRPKKSLRVFGHDDFPMAALPARSPMPLMVHSTWRAPWPMAARELATPKPRSLWQWTLIMAWPD